MRNKLQRNKTIITSISLDEDTRELLAKQAATDNRSRSQQVAFQIKLYEEYRKEVIRIPVIGTIRDGGIEFIGTDTELE